MGRRTLLINVALLGALGLAASFLVSDWQEFERGNNLASLVRSDGAGPAPALESFGERETRRQLTAFEEIRERPVFTPDRRPPDVVAEEGPAERPEPPNAEMTGSSVFGGQSRATLKISPPRGRGAAATLNVGVGDAPPQLNGWRVADVVSTAVTLQWNDEQVLLEFSPPAAPDRTQQAAATSGVNIINVGQAAPAVETSSAEAAQAEQRGLQVAVVANQNQRSGVGAGGRRGALNQGRAGAGSGNSAAAAAAAGGRTNPTRRPNRPNNRPNNN